MNIFDIIGPIMIGPSSSHTAGACRLGKVARRILNEEVETANIILSGSFAKTYFGHGTDVFLYNMSAWLVKSRRLRHVRKTESSS